MKKVLVPVDGSLDSLETIWQIIRETQTAEPLEVHLLNVQPRTFPEESMIAIPVEDIDTYYYRRSLKALESAERALHDARIAFVSHQVVGSIVDNILDKQRELDCDSIMLSTHDGAGLKGALRDSISYRVLRKARVPVILVRVRQVPDFTGRLGAT